MEFKFDHSKENYMDAINVDKSVKDELKDKKIKLMTDMYGQVLQGKYSKSRCTELILNKFSYNELVLIATEVIHDEFELLSMKYLHNHLETFLKDKK